MWERRWWFTLIQEYRVRGKDGGQRTVEAPDILAATWSDRPGAEIVIEPHPVNVIQVRT